MMNWHLVLVRSTFLAAGLLMFTGCAMTKTKVNLSIAPPPRNPLTAGEKPGIAVGKFTDRRPVADHTVVMHKVNGYGQRTTGAYIAQAPVADIFREALVNALMANAFTIPSQNPAYELQGEIQDFDYETITGFWKATLKPKVTIRFQLLDAKSRSPLWHDTFIGRSSADTAWGDAKFIAQLFSQSASDVLKQLLDDPAFRKVFE